MIIQCEACKTKFRVGDGKVKPPGIKVRCSKCGEVFFFEYSLHEDLQKEVDQNLFTEPEPTKPNLEPVSAGESEIPAAPVTGETGHEPQEVNFDNTDTVVEDEQLIKTKNDVVEVEIGESQADIPEPDDQIPGENGVEINVASEDQESFSDSFLNLEINPLDELAEKKEEELSAEELKDHTQSSESTIDQNRGIEFRSPNLIIDQEVLEQTYTKGTVASSSELERAQYSSSSNPPTVRRYSRRKKGGGFFKKLFGWFLALLLIVALFLVSMFILNEMKIYENDYFSRFDSVARSIYGIHKGNELKRTIRVKNDMGSWYSSKYGQVFVVSGEVVNTSNSPLNYLKLRVFYISDGTNVFIQELYTGNTLSKREIKNSSFNSLQAKLNRKNGDISYDDANNLDGLNFDIQPGEIIPFFSVFPAKEKILGLKYRIEVVGYESADVSQNP